MPRKKKIRFKKSEFNARREHKTSARRVSRRRVYKQKLLIPTAAESEEFLGKLAKTSRRRNKTAGDSLWDLDRDGITYSAISKFMTCPERFRLAMVEGWSETGLSAPLEFGSAFHYCLEMAASGVGEKEIPRILDEYTQTRIKENRRMTPEQIQEFENLMSMVEAVYQGYVKYWAKEDDPSKKVYISREETFRVQYPLPSGRQITLRGRWDEAYRDLSESKDSNGYNRIWLQENKTKGNIDQDSLQSMLSQDLQSMFYCVTLACRFMEVPQGILYNVIRRPQLRPKKGETIPSFNARVQDDVAARPSWYFMRWKTCLEPGDLENWCLRSLNPLLEIVVKWWDSVKHNPFDPWGEQVDWKVPWTEQVLKARLQNIHYQRPFGVYDSLGSGQRGEFFEYLTRGSSYGLKKRKEVFPELAD
jgi:hypothetical protein